MATVSEAAIIAELRQENDSLKAELASLKAVNGALMATINRTNHIIHAEPNYGAVGFVPVMYPSNTKPFAAMASMDPRSISSRDQPLFGPHGGLLPNTPYTALGPHVLGPHARFHHASFPNYGYAGYHNGTNGLTFVPTHPAPSHTPFTGFPSSLPSTLPSSLPSTLPSSIPCAPSGAEYLRVNGRILQTESPYHTRRD